ncbi:hypothetical protein [Aliikangiella maris]|uniref:Uncharacterized protein n=2 Tax=Aliikangiella maris TaxID=3162458 RepID=A0ABV2BZA8_9GAMM
MKMIIGVIVLALFSSLANSGEINAIEKKQRKLVSRFYEALEMMPNRCPVSVRNKYLKSVKEFEIAFPDFISLVSKSKYKSYAISKYSNKSPIDENTCLYFKEALDVHMNTEKGKKEMEKNTNIMRNNSEIT